MNIRRRLAILYALVWAALHLAFTLAVYSFFNYHLGVEVDESLASWSVRIQDSEAGRGFQSPGATKRLPEPTVNQYSMPDTLVVAFGEQGRLLFNQSVLSESSIEALRRFALETPGATSGSYRRILLEEERFRVLVKRIAHSAPASTYTLVVGRSLTHVDMTLKRLTVSLIFAWVFAVLLFSFVLWIFVGHTLRPIREMTVHALKIADSGELSGRITDHGGKDEFSELARALNRMLASMQLSSESQKQFLADASHELRTPLTSIKANLEFIQRVKPASKNGCDSALHDSISETDRMASLVNDLLLLARMEANPPRISEKTDLAAIAAEAAEGFRNRIETLKRVFRQEFPENSICVLGDEKDLKQAIVVLLDNAFKYTPTGGSIALRLAASDGEVKVSVEDDGPGIPPLEIDAVFRRFYRATNIREKMPGTGLGLAIAQSIVQNHGGAIELANRQPRGLMATIRLPVCP